MTFEAALAFANDLYLRNRRDFEPTRQRTGSDPKLIEKNRRQAFYDHLDAERQFRNSTKSR